MSSSYRTLRAAADAAARIGNHAAAADFARRATECDWVEVAWAMKGEAIELSGPDLGNTATWPGKRAAQDGARAIGWPVGCVVKVHHRLHGERWTLADGRFGLLSKYRLGRLVAG